METQTSLDGVLRKEAEPSSLQWLPLDSLDPHPQNPRLVMREDVIASVLAQLTDTGRFDESHALLVRPVNGRYQTIRGHHRIEAARRAGMTAVPCWVREMDDDEAFMQLVLGNSQGELSPLEYGCHILDAVQRAQGGRGNEGGLRGYARQIGKSQPAIVQFRQAAEVFRALKETDKLTYQFLDKATHLAAIHKAPADSWPALAAALLAAAWTVKDTEDVVGRVADTFGAIPAWWETVDRAAVLQVALAKPQQAKILRAAFGLAASIDAELLPARVYRHEKTDTAEERDGRIFFRWDPVASEYDQGAAFRALLMRADGLPDAASIRAAKAEVLQYVADRSDSSVRWQPELTDAEWTAEQERLRELAELGRIRLIEANVAARILQGDFREVGEGVPPDSVDLIFTDPPYHAGAIADYGDMARLAARILKPGGSLICYAGHYAIPDILPLMAEHLRYWWIIACEHSGGSARLPGKWVFVEWKPLLWFVKDARRDNEYVADRVRSQPDKKFHEWGQGVVDATYYIEHLTSPGDLVFDPFCGGGTTCLAAAMAGRRYLAAEKTREHVLTARGRLCGYLQSA